MPDASPASIDHYPAFLARLPPDLDLEALGRETKAFRRPRGVWSATDLLRLALAWGPGGYSLQRVVAWAGVQGIAELTDEVLTQRLHATVSFLEAVTSHLLRPVTPVPCWHGRVLRISDSTSLSKPASKGTDWRIHGVYDLGAAGSAIWNSPMAMAARRSIAANWWRAKSASPIAAMPMPRPGNASARPARARRIISCGCGGKRCAWWMRRISRWT
jgi:hypothetical protein